MPNTNGDVGLESITGKISEKNAGAEEKKVGSQEVIEVSSQDGKCDQQTQKLVDEELAKIREENRKEKEAIL